jgi:hypothetical protein
VYLDLFNDSVAAPTGTPGASVYQEEQYRIKPNVIFGRVNISNYLERGYELTFTPSAANFFSGDLAYYTWVTTFKNSIVVGEANFSYFINAGAMSDALGFSFGIGQFF